MNESVSATYQCVINTDGKAYPNPGKGTWGAVIQLFENGLPDGTPATPLTIKAYGKMEDGRKVTNNEAEYRAMVNAMRIVNILYPSCGFAMTNVLMKTDSELLYYQTTGEYKTKKQELRTAQKWLKSLVIDCHVKNVAITWVAREENTEADELTNLACELEHNEIIVTMDPVGELDIVTKILASLRTLTRVSANPL